MFRFANFSIILACCWVARATAEPLAGWNLQADLTYYPETSKPGTSIHSNIPLYYVENQFAYVPISYNAQLEQVHLGLAYRHAYEQTIIGAYTWYGTTKAGKLHQHLDLGVELIYSKFYYGFTLQLPIGSSLQTEKVTSEQIAWERNQQETTFNITTTSDIYNEQASYALVANIGLQHANVSTEVTIASFADGSYAGTAKMHWQAYKYIAFGITLESLGNQAKLGLSYTFSFFGSKTTARNQITKIIQHFPNNISVAVKRDVITQHQEVRDGNVPMLDLSGATVDSHTSMTVLKQVSTPPWSDIAFKDVGLHFISETASSLVLPDSLENTIIHGIDLPSVQVKKSSPLDKLLDDGYWSYAPERTFHLDALASYQSRLDGIISTEQIARVKAQGLEHAKLVDALKYELKQHTQVQLIELRYDQTNNTNLNILEKVEPALIDVYVIQRNKHANTLIVDNTKKIATFMDSTGQRLPAWQFREFTNVYSQHVYTYLNINPVRQIQSWSCGCHTFANVMGYVVNVLPPAEGKHQRRSVDVLKRILYAEHYYLEDLVS